MIKCIAFDQDDTALLSDGKPSSAGLQAVEDALDRGIVVASVSGRNIDRSSESFQHALPIFDRLYIIANNGSIIVSPVENGRRELLAEQRIPDDTFMDLLEHIEGHDYNFVYSWLRMTPDGAKDSVITNRHTLSIDAITSQNGAQIPIEPSLLQQLRDGVYPAPPKLLFLPGLEHREEVFQKLKKSFGSRIYTVKTSPDRIEIMHPEVNKKTGIEYIARRYGFSIDNIMAIGDGENDLPMLCNAGLGVVMGNAEESVRREGEKRGLVVAPTNDDDGFAWAIRKYALGE